MLGGSPPPTQPCTFETMVDIMPTLPIAESSLCYAKAFLWVGKLVKQKFFYYKTIQKAQLRTRDQRVLLVPARNEVIVFFF